MATGGGGGLRRQKADLPDVAAVAVAAAQPGSVVGGVEHIDAQDAVAQLEHEEDTRTNPATVVHHQPTLPQSN